MFWDKEVFKKYLAEELDWDSFKIRPFFKRITGGFLEVKQHEMLFGNLQFVETGTLGGVSYAENDLSEDEETFKSSDWWLGSVNASFQDQENPYGEISEVLVATTPTAGNSWLMKEQTFTVPSIVGVFLKYTGSTNTTIDVKVGSSAADTIQLQGEGIVETALLKVEYFENGWIRVQRKVDTAESDTFYIGCNSQADPIYYYGVSYYQGDTFTDYKTVTETDISEGNLTKVDNVNMTLGRQQVIGRKIEDATGRAVFIGWKAIRQ